MRFDAASPRARSLRKLLRRAGDSPSSSRNRKETDELRLMPNVSIRARLILLSVLLLAILAVSSALLIRELARDSRSLAEEATLVSVVKNANSASKHFGDLKYWVIDAAVTQLARSEEEAAAAKARLDSDLKAVSAVDPAFVAAIGREVDTMTELARKAGVAYSCDDSAAGNALLAQAKSHVPDIDDEIDKIVDQVEQQALARRDASTRQAELAVKLAIIGGLVALADRVRLHGADRALDHRPFEAAGARAWLRLRMANSMSRCPRPASARLGR